MTSLHPSDATPQTQVYGQRRSPEIAGAYDTVTGSVHRLMDAQAENRRQELLLYNPTPEVDSIVERVGHQLREDPELIALIREWVASNRREHGHVHGATGPLDLIARTLAVHPERQGLGVKRAAARLRKPLKVVLTARSETVDFKTFFLASCQIKDVIGELPSATLRGASLRNELGDGPHDVLLSLLTDGEEA